MAMAKKYQNSLFIFRRDLRLSDNTALIAAIKQSSTVIPIFIYDPIQITEKNKYKSENALQFMIESITDLKKQLAKKNGLLYEFYGAATSVILDIIKKNKIDAIFFNKDYTPFAKKRDNQIKKICANNNIDCISCHDELLQPPDTIFTQQKTPYTIFTPFFRTARTIPILKPQNLPKPSFCQKPINSSYQQLLITSFNNKKLAEHGGRTVSQRILRTIKKFENYNKERNFPAFNATTRLSAHNKFGTSSIREVYYAIKDNLGLKNDLIKELYWRDFFTYIADHFPIVFKGSFRSKYKNIQWKNNKSMFKKWCLGETGFPIVDAGMRELNVTGFMHNRVRMITSSFLIKDLHINWQWGEKYFAQKLVDYDPSVNNGNWQWVASTGSDAQPYFRIFNPWLQQKKFDPQCLYIKKWVPELKNIPPKELHKWNTRYKNHITTYSKPIVDHSKEIAITKYLYQI